LSFLTTPAPNTLFEGIRKLPGGSLLRIRLDGNVVERTYWDVWDHVQPRTNQSDETIAQELLGELRVAVKLRKMSDVPVGVFLSGGIDSSINAVLFSEGERDPIQTFSIGYDENYGSYPSELPFAREVAQRVGARHHERILDLEDLLNFVPNMVRLQDEPIADPVCVPVYYVSELARQNGVIVCQVGEGSDELFWGYRNWKMKLRLEQMNQFPVPRVLKQVVSVALNACGKSHTHYAELLRRGISRKPIFWGGAEAFSDAEKASLLSDTLKPRFQNFSSWEVIDPIYQRFRQKAWEQSILHWMTYLDLNLRLPELLLMRVDKMSMGVSLEARVPFLDHKFVEFALGIPGSVKTRNGELKAILKRAVRGAIPDSIIDRKKQGFGVPIQEWLMGKLGQVSKAILTEFCVTTNYLDPKAVDSYLCSHSPQSWFLLNFALWWNTFISPGTLKSAAALQGDLRSTGRVVESSSYASCVP